MTKKAPEPFRFGIAHAKYAKTQAPQIAALLAAGIPAARIVRSKRGWTTLARDIPKVCRKGDQVILLPGHGLSKYCLRQMRAKGATVAVRPIDKHN